MKNKTAWIVLLLWLSPGLWSEEEIRTWMLEDGRAFEAKLVLVMGNHVILQDAGGNKRKIGLSEISRADRVFIELAHPPRLDISFRRKTKKKYFSSRFSTTLLPEIQINTFGVRVRQVSAGAYNHELCIEFFAVGRERAGNRYILLDRKSSTFTPGKENERSHEFWGQAVELDEYEIFYIEKPRGKKYEGHLILVTDVQGRVIASQATHKWLLENLDDLKRLPLGAYMDDSCTRTFPTRPRPCRY